MEKSLAKKFTDFYVFIFQNSIFESQPCAVNKKSLLFEYTQILLAPHFAISTAFGSTKKTFDLLFQAPVLFDPTSLSETPD